jgi:hypothetical protein
MGAALSTGERDSVAWVSPIGEARLVFEDVCQAQAGIVTRSQAAALGVSPKAIDRHVRAQRWRRVHRGVVATFTGPLPRISELWAAVLWAGPGATLSHWSAAELLGLVEPPSPNDECSIHVTVPTQRRPRRLLGVVVHRSARIHQCRHPGRRPPQTTVEETVLDLAEGAPTVDRAVAWILRAVGRRLTTPDRLRNALRRRAKVRRRSDLHAAVEDVALGCHSTAELRYLRDVERAHGLPTGDRQRPRRRRGGRWYDDVRYEEYRTIVEIDGPAAHPLERSAFDAERDNAAVLKGYATLRIDVPRLAQPCLRAIEVTTLLWRKGWTGRPIPCGPTCPMHAFLAASS